GIKSVLSWTTVKVMLRLRFQLLEERVDVVHTYFSESCLLAPIFLKTNMINIVTSRRDMGLIYNDVPSFVFRFLRRRSDYVISNSHAVSNLVSARELIPKQRNITIYNGIE